MNDSCCRQKAWGSRYIKNFWAGEPVFLVLFPAIGNLPILDYSKREWFAYRKEPRQGNLNPLHAKQNEELRTRWLYASPLGVLAVVLAIPIYLAGAGNQRGQAENVIPASLLHNQEGADCQDVGAGTVEAADGGAGIGD